MDQNATGFRNVSTDATEPYRNSAPEQYMLVFEDVDQLFNRINYSNETEAGGLFERQQLNCSFANGTNGTCLVAGGAPDADRHYWALILVLFPIITLFGNVLVILSVYRERTLQTATNYFIVSLAVADLLVAVVVMPFAVYVLVNGFWALPEFACDFYIAMDVTCSTSSIFNLVAISIDRYIAVTQPIKYAKHKNNKRVYTTIAVVWMVSACIGCPIVMGLNYTPDRTPDVCMFYSPDFVIYSSLSSFYIPCIIMVFLYYNIFKALKKRAMQQRANRKPLVCEIKPGSVIENVANTRRLAETTLGPNPIEEQATNTGSGSGDEDEDLADPDCHVISNDKSTEFILATVVEEAAISSVVASMATPNTPIGGLGDPNGNNDSGYAHSEQPDSGVLADSPRMRVSAAKKNGAPLDTELRTVATITTRTASVRSTTSSKKEKKASSAARFTIYKVNKASRKKREKSSAKKERKATKTLAIVLGVFLICWVPFFTCNVMDAVCTKLGWACQPGLSVFLLTTWLGYMNSFVNPIIYTIFNPEFRKAFKKLMFMGP